MKNLKTKIEYCLKKYPATRNSDITLTNSIWYEFYNNKLVKEDCNGKIDYFVRLKDLYDMPKQDDVKRIRAKIQNKENRYLPTSEKVAKQRRINEHTWRAYMGYDNPAMG